MKERKDKRKLLIPLLLLLLLVSVSGTVAWLTANSTLENEFTVGSFTIPTQDPADQTQTISPALTGYIYEPAWDTTTVGGTVVPKLLPGNTYGKDPRVGIGEESEKGVVYVYVENPFSDKVYFTIDATNWTAVEVGTTTKATTVIGAPANSYHYGLFKYNTTLEPDATNHLDAWTTALFSSVVTASDADSTDFAVTAPAERKIIVKAFIHQAENASGAPIAAADIEAAAKSAFGLS